jgi:amino acid transporter
VIYVPGAGDMRSAGLLTLIGALVYACPLVVWLRYSEDIVSAGGLAAFVEAAAGRRVALVQATVWAISYFLYLPYTVADIVYEMLVVVFPGIEPWRWLLEVTLPLLFVAIVLVGTIPALRLLFVSAVLQLVVLLVFGAVLIGHVGAPGRSFTRSPGTHDLVHGSAAIALLFVCGSLPLFLGAEAVGGRRTVRRTLLTAGIVVAGYAIFAVFALAAVEPALRQGEIPGFDVAAAYSGRPLAVVVGLGAAISVAGVILAEYLALSRLLYSVTGVPVRRLLAWIAVPFVAIDALSLLSPDEFDEKILRPSLIALFLSQLIVFAVYPLYRRRRGKLSTLDLAIAAVALAVMAWGLWRGITAPVST